MSNRSSSNIFTRVYNLTRSTGLLEIPWLKRVFLSSYFLYKRWYEDPFWALTRRAPEVLGDGDILDIGANIGYTAWVFSRIVKAPAKIYAFEPDAASFATLEQVVRRKKFGDKVEIFNTAAGSADGFVDFWHNEEHSADHRVVTEQFKSPRLASEKITTVAVTSVDSFAAKRDLRSISLIKIDVQGYEMAVCEGMRRTLEEFPALCVAFEYAPDSMRELGFEPSSLLNFFRSRGFHLHVLTRAAITLTPDNRAIEIAAEGCGYVDLLCSKRILA